jgi:hypothetical protein
MNDASDLVLIDKLAGQVVERFRMICMEFEYGYRWEYKLKNKDSSKKEARLAAYYKTRQAKKSRLLTRAFDSVVSEEIQRRGDGFCLLVRRAVEARLKKSERKRIKKKERPAARASAAAVENSSMRSPPPSPAVATMMVEVPSAPNLSVAEIKAAAEEARKRREEIERDFLDEPPSEKNLEFDFGA